MEEEEILSSMNETDDVDMIGDDLDIAADENTSDVVSNENENIPDSEESPNAGSSKDAKTTRKSSRLATKPKVRDKLQAMGLVRGIREWKESEKRQFLEACKLHGSKNVDLIAADVPSKTYEQVKAFVHREKKNQNYTIQTKFIETGGRTIVVDDGEGPRRRGRPKGSGKTRLDLPDATPQGEIVEVEKRRKRNAPIEKWIDSAESKLNDDLKKAGGDTQQVVDYSPMVPKMLEMVAEYEKHPSPDQCGGVDFAAIYRWLGCLCEGEAPPDLNSASSLRVRRLFSRLAKTVSGEGLEKETDYLKEFRGPHTKYQTGKDWEPGSMSALNMAKVVGVPGLNPLGLHTELFTAKETPRPSVLLRERMLEPEEAQ